jgi:SOS-response transcriptional repressor LexA
MKKLTTLGERIAWGLARIGSNPHQAAPALGCTAAHIYNLKNGTTKALEFKLGIRLANYLQVCPIWLATGKQRSGISITKGAEKRDLPDNPDHPLLARSIPVIAWEEAAKIDLRLSKDIPERPDRQLIADPTNTSLHNYALVMQGDSMIGPGEFDSFKEGDYLYFDPTIAPYIGCYVLARDKKRHEAYFRRLILDCGVPYLIPNNHPCFPAIRVTNDIHINGVLVDTHRRYEHIINPKNAQKKIKYLADILKKGD